MLYSPTRNSEINPPALKLRRIWLPRISYLLRKLGRFLLYRCELVPILTPAMLKRPIPLIILTALIFIAPALILGTGGGDTLYHMLRSENFAEQLWSGELYPRWMYKKNAGCGSSVFFFYYPISYYFASLFHFTHNLPPQGWYPLALAAFTAITLGGIFCYMWLRLFTERTAALCGAILYIALPYPAISFYLLMSYQEFFTFAWLPLQLYFIHKMAMGDKSAISGYIIALALQVMSSIPGTIVTGAIPVLYYMFIHFQQKALGVKSVATILAAITLSAALLAIYLLPLVNYLEFAQLGNTNKNWEGKFYYSENFLFSIPKGQAAAAHGSVLITTTIIVAVMLFALVMMWRNIRKSKDKLQLQSNFWFIIALGAVFMMSPLSGFVWELIPVIQKIQFPWRINLALGIAAVAITAILMQTLSHGKKYKDKIFMFGVIAVLSLSMSVEFGISSRQEFNETKQLYYDLNTYPMGLYLPKWVDKDWVHPSKIHQLKEYCLQQIHAGDSVSTEVTKWQARDIRFTVENTTDTDTEITMSQFYFPGWIAGNADNPQQIYEIHPEEKDGIGTIKITIPPGKHKINLELETLPAERYGFIISLITFILLAGWWIYYKNRKWVYDNL